LAGLGSLLRRRGADNPCTRAGTAVDSCRTADTAQLQRDRTGHLIWPAPGGGTGWLCGALNRSELFTTFGRVVQRARGSSWLLGIPGGRCQRPWTFHTRSFGRSDGARLAQLARGSALGAPRCLVRRIPGSGVVCRGAAVGAGVRALRRCADPSRTLFPAWVAQAADLVGLAGPTMRAPPVWRAADRIWASPACTSVAAVRPVAASFD